MANTLKIKRSTSTATPTSLSEGELAYSEDSGNLFIGTANSNIAKIGGNTDVTKLALIEASATADQTDEEIQDIVGAMLTGNTESGITVTYQDGDGTIDFTVASQTDENFTTADHSKLDGIASSANNYTHPTGAGNKHIPTGGSSGQFLKYDSSGTAVWSADNNTTYSVQDGELSQNNFTDALKTNYDAVHSWYSTMTTADGNSVIDTVTEIVSAFENHAEGLNLITELDAKLTASSTIDGGSF